MNKIASHCTIMMTGGHITPALAVLDALQKKRPSCQYVFVGRTKALEGSDSVSVEEALIRKRKNIQFVPITAGRLLRVFSWKGLIGLVKIPIGFIQALWICLQYRPEIIISFGGYIGLPIAISAWVLGIPVVTHEQTTRPGLTNKIIAHFATRIFVSFEETKKYFPPAKTTVTGLPIRSELFQTGVKPPEISLGNLPLVYVTGGVTGAASLNKGIFSQLNTLLRKYVLIHQTGSITFDEAQHVKNTLPSELRERYHIFEYVSVEYLAWIYKNTACVIGRSGANTITELALFHIPSILVPLPWASDNEQLYNAQWLEKNGIAKIVLQPSLSSISLADTVSQVILEKDTQKGLYRKLFTPEPHSGAIIADQIDAILT